MFQQVVNRLAVDFDDFELEPRIADQILRQHAGAGADFQHGTRAAERGHDGLRHVLVGEEVLAQGFLGPDGLSHLAMKCLYIRAMP